MLWHRGFSSTLNGLMPEPNSGDPLAAAIRKRDRDALARMPQALRKLSVDSVSLRPMDMVGVEALQTLLSERLPNPEPEVAEPFAMPVGAASLDQLVDEIAENVLCDGEVEVHDVEVLSDMLARLGLADVREFGVSWEDCSTFLSRLGYQLQVDAIPMVA